VDVGLQSEDIGLSAVRAGFTKIHKDFFDELSPADQEEYVYAESSWQRI